MLRIRLVDVVKKRLMFCMKFVWMFGICIVVLFCSCWMVFWIVNMLYMLVCVYERLLLLVFIGRWLFGEVWFLVMKVFDFLCFMKLVFLSL